MKELEKLDLLKDGLPGYVAIFNVADFKRRNCHLGHLVGDQDIENLINIGRVLGKDKSEAIMIAGGVLFCVFDLESKIFEFIQAYSKVEEIVITLKCCSKLNEKRLEKSISQKSRIYRALRCVYKFISNENELIENYENLKSMVFYAKPNEPIILNKDFISNQEQRERWECVDNPIKELPKCLFCGGKNFSWIDGDTRGGQGICKNCGAEFEFEEDSCTVKK